MNNIKVIFHPPTKWKKSPTWELIEPYTTQDGNITVPAGFITDGASIPRFIYPLFLPVGRYFGAAIVHDFLLVGIRDWDTANREFEKEMIALNVKPWRIKIIMTFVRLWAKIHKAFNLPYTIGN